MTAPKQWFAPHHGAGWVGWVQKAGGISTSIGVDSEFARARIKRLCDDMNALCDQAMADLRAQPTGARLYDRTKHP